MKTLTGGFLFTAYTDWDILNQMITTDNNKN